MHTWWTILKLFFSQKCFPKMSTFYFNENSSIEREMLSKCHSGLKGVNCFTALSNLSYFVFLFIFSTYFIQKTSWAHCLLFECQSLAMFSPLPRLCIFDGHIFSLSLSLSLFEDQTLVVALMKDALKVVLKMHG